MISFELSSANATGADIFAVARGIASYSSISFKSESSEDLPEKSLVQSILLVYCIDKNKVAIERHVIISPVNCSRKNV